MPAPGAHRHAPGGEPALKLDTTPSVALFIGVNGVGKTTTIGKLSARMKGRATGC